MKFPSHRRNDPLCPSHEGPILRARGGYLHRTFFEISNVFCTNIKIFHKYKLSTPPVYHAFRCIAMEKKRTAKLLKTKELFWGHKYIPLALRRNQCYTKPCHGNMNFYP